MAAHEPSIWDEIIEFLVSGSTLEQIVAYEGSEDFQERVSYLRDANRNSVLTSEERTEIDAVAEIGRFMRRLKIRALEKMKQTEILPQS